MMPSDTTPISRHASALWHRLALAAILLLAAFLSFYRISQEGFANLYYAATVKSMLTSWHSFFFVSYDSAGFVSVDKPPLGLWVQAISAAIFGFHGWALILPQALAGVLSVWVLYHLVRRVFGPTAGVIAALVLAVTPISVAANRNNTMDSLLVLTSLLAAWAASLAADPSTSLRASGRLCWLLVCAVLVGIGFNIKMLQAYMVLPALFLVYLLAPIAWWKRLLHLTLATVVLVVVSLSWAVIVDLTPPDDRPYVGSSQDNTVMELIIGHNGMSRLMPGGLRRLLGIVNGTGPGAAAPYGRIPVPPGGMPPSGGYPPLPPGVQPGQPNPVGPRPAGGSPTAGETGEPGVLRLFNQQLAGQISWLLPLIALTLPLIPSLSRRAGEGGGRGVGKGLFLWVMWLLPQIVFFSFANLFHRYYLEMLSPGIAALVGAGVVALREHYRRPGWKGWLLPLALLICAAVEAAIIFPFPPWFIWLAPLVVGLALFSATALATLRLVTPNTEYAIRNTPRIAYCVFRIASILGLLALLIAPTLWSLTPLLYGGDSGLPYAGPELARGRSSGPTAENSPVSAKLVRYLLSEYDGERFLLATMRSMDASPIALATDLPVMAMGGFSGSDRILTADELAGMVAAGEVRFVLLTGEPGAQQQLAEWVVRQCTPIPSGLWSDRPAFQPQPGAGRQPGQQPYAQPGPGGNQQLFDCGNLNAL